MSARGLLDAVRIGPVRTQAEDVIEMLSDAQRCQVILVTLPEETPVNELVDTAFALEDRVGVKLGPIVVNAVPGALDVDGHAVTDDARLAGVDVSDADVAALEAATAFHRDRHALALVQAERLAERLPLPQLRLPFVFGELGASEVELLADVLVEQIDALPVVTA